MNKTSVSKYTVKFVSQYFIAGLVIIYSHALFAAAENPQDLLKTLEQPVEDNISIEAQNTSPSLDDDNHGNDADKPSDAAADKTELTEESSKTPGTDSSLDDESSEKTANPPGADDTSEETSREDTKPGESQTDTDTSAKPDNENAFTLPEDESQSPTLKETTTSQGPGDLSEDGSTGGTTPQENQTEDDSSAEPDEEEAASVPEDDSQSAADDSTSKEEPHPALPMAMDRKVRKVEHGKTEVQAEVEYETTYHADDPVFEKEEFLARVKSFTNYEITENFSIYLDLDLVFDGEEELISQSNRFLDREGLNVDKIQFEYRNDWMSLFAGRFEPAYDLFPNTPAFFGNYSHYIDLSEKVGFGGSLKLGEGLVGEHWLTTNHFHLDTSFLSSPLFTDDGRINKEDGGISNTEKFNNYLVTLNGGEAYQKPGVSYTIGYGIQRAGVGRDLDERMFIGGLYGHIKPSDNYYINLALEHVNLENAGGFNEDHSTLTFGAFYGRWPWGIGTAYSERRVTPHDTFDEDRTDRIFEVIGRYFFGDHIGLETAIEILNENNEDEKLFGIVLVYYFDDIPYFRYK